MFLVIWIIPLAADFLLALKSSEELYAYPIWSIPSHINLIDNITTVWSKGIGMTFLNSLLYAFVSATAAVFLASLVAYATTKFDFKGREILFYLTLIGTFLPFQMYLIPHLHILRWFNLYDTRLGLILIYTAICIPFAALVERNYFFTISDQLIESARLDGLSHLQIYRRIVLPLATPALIVAFLFQFIWVWNNMLFGLVLTASRSTSPIMVRLMQLKGGYESSLTLLSAGVLVAIIVPLIVVLLFQDEFIKGFRMRA